MHRRPNATVFVTGATKVSTAIAEAEAMLRHTDSDARLAEEHRVLREHLAPQRIRRRRPEEAVGWFRTVAVYLPGTAPESMSVSQ